LQKVKHSVLHYFAGYGISTNGSITSPPEKEHKKPEKTPEKENKKPEKTPEKEHKKSSASAHTSSNSTSPSDRTTRRSSEKNKSTTEKSSAEKKSAKADTISSSQTTTSSGRRSLSFSDRKSATGESSNSKEVHRRPSPRKRGEEEEVSMSDKERAEHLAEFQRLATEGRATLTEASDTLAKKFRSILAKRNPTPKERAEFTKLDNHDKFLSNLKLVKEDAILKMDLGEFSTYI
jgi:hypothetical protein